MIKAMMKAEPVSVVIRAWNEAAQLQRLFEVLAEQDYPGKVELIVVDNGSTDDTAKVAKSHGAKVVTLPQKDFSYPKSLNVGIAAANYELVAEIVAHALPIGSDWLSSAVSHFGDPRVAGVYSPTRARPGSNLLEVLLYNPNYYRTRIVGPKLVKHTHMGVFGATNIMLRKSLWQEHHFDERFGAGGEDIEWAGWVLSLGYVLVRAPKFAVYHSHGLKFRNLLKQQKYWLNLKTPRSFSKIELSAYRPDLYGVSAAVTRERRGHEIRET